MSVFYFVTILSVNLLLEDPAYTMKLIRVATNYLMETLSAVELDSMALLAVISIS